MKLVVCITGHGFGHATRTILVVRELRRLVPGLELTLRTSVPAWLLRRELGEDIEYIERSYEPGTAQKNCFEVDVPGTRELYRHYVKGRPRLLREETRFLASSSCQGLLADIPAVPLAAAHAAGVRSAGLWNFTWDWILEPILKGGPAGDGISHVPDLLRGDYALADLHLRLPFSTDHCSLPRVVDVPLVGRTATLPRETTLRAAGVDPSDRRPVVLLAMGGWDCSNWSPVPVRGCKHYRFLVVGDIPLATDAEVHRLAERLGTGYGFSDLVAACDAVLSKPGYGMASECVVNRTPLVGIERRGFREAGELVRGLRSLGPFEGISLAEFFDGKWEPSLDRLLREPARPWSPVPRDGAAKVAAMLQDHFRLG